MRRATPRTILLTALAACDGGRGGGSATPCQAPIVVGDDFESGAIDPARWTIEGGTWRVAEGQLVGGDGTTQPGGYGDQIHFEQAVSGSYVLQVDVTGGSPFGLAWNAESTSRTNMIWFGNANRRIDAYGDGQWPPPSGNTAEWMFDGPITQARLDVDGKRATVYANGTRLGYFETTLDGGKVGLWAYLGTLSFDNFCVEQ